MPERQTINTRRQSITRNTKKNTLTPIVAITTPNPLIKVDFNQVTIQALRSYKRHHKLPLRVNASKQELAEAITRHFSTIPFQEEDEDVMIEDFLRAVRQQDSTSDDSESSGSSKSRKKNTRTTKNSTRSGK